MKVLITTSSFGLYSDEPIKRLKESNLEIITNPLGRKLRLEESLDLYSEEIQGVIAGTEDITEEVLNRAKSLRVISRCGIGTDGIDLNSAANKNIHIYKTTTPLVDAVAELTVGLILSSLRHIALADRNIRNQEWKKPMGRLFKGKTLGVVGTGSIGKRVMGLCKGFGVDFIGHDLNRDSIFAARDDVTYADLDELLTKSDIISIHLPLTDQTKNIIDADKLKLMKKDALLVNTSRGHIIDEKALYQALKEGKIAGAALDVFADEPYYGNLKELDNVILTSHIGSYAREVRVKMEIEAVDNLIKGLDRKKQNG